MTVEDLKVGDVVTDNDNDVMKVIEINNQYILFLLILGIKANRTNGDVYHIDIDKIGWFLEIYETKKL